MRTDRLQCVFSSPEKCLGGSATNLGLALSFGPHSETRTLLSVNIDASTIAGEINFRQLQDFLCFKAVWLDRLEQLVPVPPSGSLPPEKVPDKAQGSSTSTLITVVVARVQEVRLTCMLGVSIGTVNFAASQLVGRLRLIPEESRAFSVDLQNLKATSKGRLNGHFNTNGLYFENNHLQLQSGLAPSIKTYVRLSAWIGGMDTSLEFDYRKVLLVQSDPIRVGATDDWSEVSSKNQLRLDFSLRFGTFNVMATTQAVPTLVRLSKDMEKLLEERAAKARIELFGVSNVSQTVKELSTRKIDTKKEETGLQARVLTITPCAIPSGVHVISTIQLEVDRLRLAIYLHHFTDPEAFQGDAGSVRAQLERGINDEDVVTRNLHLHLGFFGIRKLRPKKVTPVQEHENTLEDWFEHLRAVAERNIVKIPTSEARMSSTQEKDSNSLYHRFSLIFTGQVDISLNYALLKQLGELLAAYQEGMKRVRETESRTAPSSPSSELPPGGQPGLGMVVGSGNESDKEQFAKLVHPQTIPPPPNVDVIRSLEYIALENNIQQPQLQLLGDGKQSFFLSVLPFHFTDRTVYCVCCSNSSARMAWCTKRSFPRLDTRGSHFNLGTDTS